MSASSSKCLLLTLFYLFFKIAVVSSNGILTHIVISYRTLTYFGGIQPSSIDYGKLIDKHHDALLSGSVFPDVFYNDQCAKGNYSFASDDAHWAPFLNTTLNYINTKYPKPWDDSTEKLVVFTMGMLSHQVADVLWNSYGIQQGFISTMANLNFHGSVADAMKFGELGGDVIADYDLNMGFIQPFTDWYVPVDDLVNIYNAFYGSERLPRLVIQNCSTTMLFSIIKEKAGISEYFIELAPESPFMVNQMFDYFLGGVDSSAGWVHRKWSDAAIMLENGTSTCTVPRNPLFINCDKKKKSYVDDDSLLDGHHMNHVFSLLSRDGHNYDPKDVEVNRTLRGITMRPSKHYRIQIEKEMLETTYLIEKKYPHRKPIDKNLDPYNEDLGLDYTGVYYVNSSYAKLGWATEVGDVDGDSYADMIIGAPCYGEVGAPQQGRVFFVYGTKEELPGFGYIEVNLDNTTVNCTNFIKSPSLVFAE